MESYDFLSKQIVTFATSGSSDNIMQKLIPKAKVDSGKRFSEFQYYSQNIKVDIKNFISFLYKVNDTGSCPLQYILKNYLYQLLWYN